MTLSKHQTWKDGILELFAYPPRSLILATSCDCHIHALPISDNTQLLSLLHSALTPPNDRSDVSAHASLGAPRPTTRAAKPDIRIHLCFLRKHRTPQPRQSRGSTAKSTSPASDMSSTAQRGTPDLLLPNQILFLRLQGPADGAAALRRTHERIEHSLESDLVESHEALLWTAVIFSPALARTFRAV